MGLFSRALLAEAAEMMLIMDVMLCRVKGLP